MADDPAAALRAELMALEKTRALVARKPNIVRALAPLVALYRPGGQWWQFRKARFMVKTGPSPALRQKGRALAQTIERLEAALDDRDLASWLMREGLVPMIPGLASLAETLAVLRREAEQLGGSPGRRGGRPTDPWRERFCSGIARTLRAAGEPVTKSRDGLFAQVLAAAFMAAGAIPPEDLFPLVRRSACE